VRTLRSHRCSSLGVDDVCATLRLTHFKPRRAILWVDISTSRRVVIAQALRYGGLVWKVLENASGTTAMAKGAKCAQTLYAATQFLRGTPVLECLWTAMNHTMVGLAYLFCETAIQSLSEDVVQTVEHSVFSYRKGRSLDARPCFQTV